MRRSRRMRRRRVAARDSSYAAAVSTIPGVAVVQGFSAYPDIPASPARRTNSTPFQISVAPYFQCGQNINLALSLQTATHNSFTIPVTLISGSAGTAVPFDNPTVSAIPDGGTLNSTLIVSGITAPIVTLSNVTRDGVDDLKRLLLPGRTYCFVGSSGVGKSTLINRLIGRQILETNMVSGTGEGRHTTVRRELIVLNNGAMLIDNPGMREFGMLGAEEGIGSSFADIYTLASKCKYGDCSHYNELGCAVLSALEAGNLHV